MEGAKEFMGTAKSLSRNPLGIIALFIVLIYGFAALVLSLGSHLLPQERAPIVWFLVVFPVLVLAVFAWLVSRHYEKLYAPHDFNSDDAFLKTMQERREGRSGLAEMEAQIEQKIQTYFSSEELLSFSTNNADLKDKLQSAADNLTNDIRSSLFITVDARKFTGSDHDLFELPAGAFTTLDDLTTEIFFLLQKHVFPFEYGFSWVLKNAQSGEVIQNLRMLAKVSKGVPYPDIRLLSEAGISPGMKLEVVKPGEMPGVFFSRVSCRQGSPSQL